MSNEKASIVCFEQFIEAFLTESSKSPAEVAKSNKQWRFDNGIGVCYIEKQKRKEPAGACVTG